MFPRPIQKLRPIVSSCTRRYAGKVRYGRGFTLAELKAAGLSATFARTVGISVDHRRTSTSEEQLQLNTERLNTYKSKLILFPRKDGKAKKRGPTTLDTIVDTLKKGLDSIVGKKLANTSSAGRSAAKAKGGHKQAKGGKDPGSPLLDEWEDVGAASDVCASMPNNHVHA